MNDNQFVELPDTKCVIIANHSLDQFTHYNFPACFSDYTPEQLNWLRVFEKLYHVYLRDKKKKEFCIKRVYALETYLLYAKGNLLIYAVINNGESEREPIEIGQQILSDAKEFETTSFILKHI